MRTLITFTVACAALTASCTVGRPLAVAGSPVADVSRGMPVDAQRPSPSLAFRPGLGVRAGMARYPDASTHPVEPRAFVAVFTHLAERETSRVEIESAYHPSARDPSENYYLTLDARYVWYVGASEKIHASLGAGGGWEQWYSSRAAAPLVSASVGYWLPGGPRGIDLRASLQAPLAADGDAGMVVAVSLGMDL